MAEFEGSVAHQPGAAVARIQLSAQEARRRHTSNKDVTNAQLVDLERKEISVIGRENPSGAFVEIKELHKKTKNWDRVVVPVEGLEALIIAMQHVAAELHTAGLMPA
jgi:hypothetical protein